MGSVVPTHVGVYRAVAPGSDTSCSCPHARGGVPRRSSDIWGYLRLSSRTWGCTEPVPVRFLRERVVPTHVGVYRKENGTKAKELRGKRVPPEIAEFGKILRQLREHYGLSQHELARRSRVPYHTIHRLEAGQIPKPSFDDLARIAKFFGIDLEAMGILLGLWGPEEIPAALDPELHQYLEQLRRVASRLSPEEQHTLAIQLRPLVSYWSPEKTALPDWLLELIAPRKERQ